MNCQLDGTKTKTLILIIHIFPLIILFTISVTGMELTTPNNNVTLNSTKYSYETIDSDRICIKLKLENAEVLRNPITMKVLKCVLSLGSTTSAQVDGQRFQACMRTEGIALNDPILPDILEYAPPEKCVPPKASMEPNNPDLKNIQRMLCLTYVSTSTLFVSKTHRFLCKIEDVQLDETDQQTLIGLYR